MTSDRETSALEKARARRELRKAVEGVMNGGLDRDACRDVLADLLVELSEDGDRALAPIAQPARMNGVAHGARPALRKAGRPKGTTTRGGRGLTKRVLAILAEHPKIPIRELAKLTFGADGKREVNRTRAVLTAQKKMETVRNVGQGEWEVVPPKP
jgi:hypothetical protein